MSSINKDVLSVFSMPALKRFLKLGPIDAKYNLKS